MKYVLIIMIWHGSQLEPMEHSRYPTASECVEAGFALKQDRWSCVLEDKR